MRSRASVTLLLALGGCAGGQHRLVSDVPVKIGRPYAVRGRSYVPRADPDYDATGLAGWYGAEHQGGATASGERYDRCRVSAAHPTLPLPTYVAVTALATGRTILVRINDRGPFGGDGRIIDLSERAATALGLRHGGPAMVRVRVVTPSAADARALRSGHAAAPMPDAPLASSR